jgi:hypothetical protein
MMAGPESKFSRRALTTQLKEEHALDLRLAGHTYDVIAAQVGYASRSSAYRAVERAFQRIRAHTDQTADQLRQLEDARYDRMLRAIDAKVQQGDLVAIDRALRVSQARRQLWGLDAPTRIDAGVSPAMAALLQQWQGLREQPAPTRQALPPADYPEAELVPNQDSRQPGQTARDATFAMLDRLNHVLDDEPNDDSS